MKLKGMDVKEWPHYSCGRKQQAISSLVMKGATDFMNRILFRTTMARTISFIAFLLISAAWGRVELLTKDSTVNLGISSTDWIQGGQIVDGYVLGGQEIYHQWLQQSFLDLGVDAVVSERIRVVAGIEGEMFLNTPKGGASSQQYYIWRLNSSLIIDKAYGSYLWGDTASPWLSVTFGRFPYKYNPDARNLGEYLFRSGTYPGYLINNFDLPFARLTGFKLTNNLFGMLHQDLLLTFETDIPPYYDASLSYIANCDVGKYLNVGVGVEFAHLISVDESQTTPVSTRTKYTIGNDTTSHYYTFRGTKLMGRVSFDPKPFIPFAIFGKEDLKMYAEAAILGVQNYPANDSINSTNSNHNNIYGYDTLKNRIPVLIGFNVPTFRLLDVLSIEGEWYGCNYPNNYATELGKGNLQSLPLPDFYGRSDWGYVTEDNWKWSIYMKKMFKHDHFGVIMQLARDHMRVESLLDEAKYYDLEESLGQKRMWAWMMKFVAQF
jgi:hypothetical protein